MTLAIRTVLTTGLMVLASLVILHMARFIKIAASVHRNHLQKQGLFSSERCIFCETGHSPMIRPASAEVTFLNTRGTLGNGDGQFSSPFGVAVAGTGQVCVAARPLDRRGVCGPWRDAPREATTILWDGVFHPVLIGYTNKHGC